MPLLFDQFIKNPNKSINIMSNICNINEFKPINNKLRKTSNDQSREQTQNYSNSTQIISRKNSIDNTSFFEEEKNEVQSHYSNNTSCFDSAQDDEVEFSWEVSSICTENSHERVKRNSSYLNLLNNQLSFENLQHHPAVEPTTHTTTRMEVPFMPEKIYVDFVSSVGSSSDNFGGKGIASAVRGQGSTVNSKREKKELKSQNKQTNSSNLSNTIETSESLINNNSNRHDNNYHHHHHHGNGNGGNGGIRGNISCLNRDCRYPCRGICQLSSIHPSSSSSSSSSQSELHLHLHLQLQPQPQPQPQQQQQQQWQQQQQQGQQQWQRQQSQFKRLQRNQLQRRESEAQLLRMEEDLEYVSSIQKQASASSKVMLSYIMIEKDIKKAASQRAMNFLKKFSPNEPGFNQIYRMVEETYRIILLPENLLQQLIVVLSEEQKRLQLHLCLKRLNLKANKHPLAAKAAEKITNVFRITI